jgi:hypothetical protein
MPDFRDLANSLVNNGQFHLPPNDIVRMGQVIGYDPNYNTTIAGGHDHPYLTVTMAGDATPMHGVRFAETYTPNLGDTVWIVVSGSDAWVMSKLTDVPNGNGNVRSPTTPGIIGHAKTTDTTACSTSTATVMNGTAITTGILPNRIYKVEANFTFGVTNAAPVDLFSGTWANHSTTITITGTSPSTTGLYPDMAIAGDGIPSNTTIVSVGTTTIVISQQTTKAHGTDTTLTVLSTHYATVGVMTPTGFQELNTSVVQNGSFTTHGQLTWLNNNTSGSYPYNWTGTYPNAQYTWHLAVKASATGGTPPTVTGISQDIVINDLGVAN